MSYNKNSGRATFSIASIIAILAAIFSFTTNAFFGMVLAVVAIVFGLFGVLLALSPARRGGIASILAVIAGCLGIVAAVIKAIMWLF